MNEDKKGDDLKRGMKSEEGGKRVVEERKEQTIRHGFY